MDIQKFQRKFKINLRLIPGAINNQYKQSLYSAFCTPGIH